MSQVTRFASAQVPTPFGIFEIFVYKEAASGAEHVALVRGPVAGRSDVWVRVHSECFTAEVLYSMRCDCREQLDLALEKIAEADMGALVYLRQEGRGIGLGNKVKAYALQDEGYDTVEANLKLGFAEDLRQYDPAAAIIQDLGIESIVLLTNNPLKVESLKSHGVKVTRREPHGVRPHDFNRLYLQTKHGRMGHSNELATKPAESSVSRATFLPPSRSRG